MQKYLLCPEPWGPSIWLTTEEILHSCYFTRAVGEGSWLMETTNSAGEDGYL